MAKDLIFGKRYDYIIKGVLRTSKGIYDVFDHEIIAEKFATIEEALESEQGKKGTKRSREEKDGDQSDSGASSDKFKEDSLFRAALGDVDADTGMHGTNCR